MMKVTLRFSSLLFGLLLWTINAWAQPVNDMCSGAIQLTIGADEASAVQLPGDTRGTEDASADGIPVCSANFYRDDVWYYMTVPDTVSINGYTIKCYYQGMATDVPAFGIALYYSCDADASNEPFVCLNSPAEDKVTACADPGQTIYIRVWSAAGDATNWETGEGTFRIAAFAREVAGGTSNFNVLWGDQPGEGDFAGGLNNWTTESVTCADNADPVNAQWTWTASGLPGYTFGGGSIAPINSPTLCNGAMIFDSGYLDLGDSGVSGEGPCPINQEGSLISPVIDVAQFGVFGVSVVFNQSMQRWREGLHFLDYSTDGGATWTINEINSDYTYLSTSPSTGSGYYNEQFRLRLPGAQNSSQLRLRFRFQGTYYWWVIDDVKIVETEANNLVAQKNFYAIPPWGTIPSDQVPSYFAENDILNIGAGPQTNVNLNHTIRDTNSAEVIYDQNLAFGTITPDSLAENKVFPQAVIVPNHPASYEGTYLVSQDQQDFDTTNNIINFYFDVGGDYFAHETGATRSVAVANSAYDAGAPLSYGYGNIFRPEVDVAVKSIQWGVSNATEMIDKAVSIYLLQWTDTNGDQIAESTERKFVGIADYTFTGTEGDDVILESVLDNFENPGQPIIMKAGFYYIALVEYVASTVDDPQFFLLASEDRNFNATVLASDTAYVKGWTDHRTYMTALEFSPDGILANVDIEVKDLSPTDTRVHFGDDIVPVVRVITTNTNTVEPLPANNLITVYPNPANNNVQVKMEFEKSYDRVQLRLIDNLGRLVYQKQLSQVPTSHIESIRTSDFAAGTYLLHVVTSDGQRSMPVVIVR
jgi:hypothetical protein